MIVSCKRTESQCIQITTKFFILHRFNKNKILDLTEYRYDIDVKMSREKERKEDMKKLFALTMAMMMSITVLAGCGNQESTDVAEDGTTGSMITVVSREDGSGTRGAFIELFGIEEKDENGEKVDHTTEMAEITNSTAVMMTTIAGNPNSIGYVSLGSLKDDVKAVQIDGVEATAENIKSGTYKVARPFHIAVKDQVSEAAQDFISFIMSQEGQTVIEENGYISQGSTNAYEPSGATGKVIIAGSSSIAPVMEKLKEAYIVKNPNATIEIQQNDSTTGMTSLAEGTCDIGMASRALKDSELEKGLQPTVIAMDGIAVIVNHENTVSNLTQEQVKSIFTGEITDWSEIA